MKNAHTYTARHLLNVASAFLARRLAGVLACLCRHPNSAAAGLLATRQAATHRARLAVLLLSTLLSACASNSLSRAPHAPDQPWVASNTELERFEALPAQARQQAQQTGQPSGFALPRTPALAQLPEGPEIRSNHPYSLPELIDLAQRHNPETRLAWNNARQAALAVGMAEATFLPMLSANVIGGWRKTRTPIGLLPSDPKLKTETHGIVPMLALNWLLFDFGGRQALLESAEQASYTANVLFNAAHQKVILDVSTAYYNYGAARKRADIARQTLKNAETVAHAARERQQGGIGTTVETAQAQQQVAQARLRLVNAQGTEEATYQALLAATGLAPLQTIQVQALNDQGLPTAHAPVTEAVIRQALAQRPDVLAAWSAFKISQAKVRAAKAQFRPKVFLSAIAARNRASFDAGGLPALNVQTSSNNVLLGLTIPLYDAGLRSAHLHEAKIEVDKASNLYQQTQKAAAREIILATDALHTALAAYHAATELETAAATTYNAALEAFRHGLDTVTVVTLALTGLEDARQARSDAHALALAAAASLAFLMGEMTSAQTTWTTPTTRAPATQ